MYAGGPDIAADAIDFLLLSKKNPTPAAINTPPTATPIPMPAFAPMLSPPLLESDPELGVELALALALGVPSLEAEPVSVAATPGVLSSETTEGVALAVERTKIVGLFAPYPYDVLGRRSK